MDYVSVPTRVGEDGAIDKAQIANAMAEWTVLSNREFLDLVRETVNAEKSAEGQSRKWFDFVKTRTYSRELGDIFASPETTAKFGGDCDDQTILLLAGFMALGLPCVSEVITREIDGQQHGVHIRVRAGFPPHDPPKDYAKWSIFDPTSESESQWIGSDAVHKAPDLDTKVYTNGVAKIDIKKHVAPAIIIGTGIALLAVATYMVSTSKSKGNGN